VAGLADDLGDSLRALTAKLLWATGPRNIAKPYPLSQRQEGPKLARTGKGQATPGWMQ